MTTGEVIKGKATLVVAWWMTGGYSVSVLSASSGRRAVASLVVVSIQILLLRPVAVFGVCRSTSRLQSDMVGRQGSTAQLLTKNY